MTTLKHLKEDNKMDVKEQLTKLVEFQMELMKDLKPGTDEYKSAADALAKLLDKLNEIDRNEYDYWDKKESREKENELKLKQLKSEKTDRIVKNCLTGTSVVGGIALAIWGTLVSLNFEKTGSVTTLAGRGIISNLIPKKWS